MLSWRAISSRCSTSSLCLTRLLACQRWIRYIMPATTTPKPVIVDEAAAVGWAIGEFGEYAVHMRLSDIGKTDVLAAYARGVAVPGVEQPLDRPGTPRFTPSRDVVALVQGMVSRGVLTAADLPMIGGA